MALATVALGLGAAGAAFAVSTPHTDFSFTFSSQTPGSATGARLYILYKNPSDPNANPSALRELRLEAPTGTRFDTTVIPACGASDVELRASGPGACPAGSRIGDGSLTVMTGLGAPFDPFPTDATLFNTGDGILELFTQPGSGRTLGIDRTKFTGPSTLTAHPPQTQGAPPDGESSVREVRFAYDAVRGRGGRAYMRTPAACPSSGEWTSRVVYKTAAGASYSATSATPCRRAGKARPRLRVRVSPRRVVAGTRRRFRVRVSSSDPSCARRARIRFAGRRLRTNRRGRVRFGVRIRRAGRYRVVARKRGCRRGSARVLVRPRR